jgi:8-oxo-dGTP pyrophosphatase MutT (NUDIX family)
MYTIFIKNKPLVLTTNQEDVRLEVGNFFLRHDSPKTLLYTLEAFEQNDAIQKLYVLDPNLDDLLKTVKSAHTIVTAAGGLVKNSKGELLFIFRNGKWDLPKGKIESGENPKEAALREVVEECGISNISVIKELQTTYHTYRQDNQRLLKKTHWFEMLSDSTDLKPQASEGITEAKWIPKNELSQVLQNTYRSIQEVVTGINLS